jgi:hypothetical protein
MLHDHKSVRSISMNSGFPMSLIPPSFTGKSKEMLSSEIVAISSSTPTNSYATSFIDTDYMILLTISLAMPPSQETNFLDDEERSFIG